MLFEENTFFSPEGPDYLCGYDRHDDFHNGFQIFPHPLFFM